MGDATLFELHEMQLCGLTPLECLISATRVNAEAYRKYDKIGSIDCGKKADMILSFTDPTEDTGNIFDL